MLTSVIWMNSESVLHLFFPLNTYLENDSILHLLINMMLDLYFTLKLRGHRGVKRLYQDNLVPFVLYYLIYKSNIATEIDYNDGG